ncbi:MAG: DUF1643 domain-containing protein [Candidatus Brocadiales bacterium]|nr:DUF1643 domain-containing protein [Candidatus Bathyanammoxibius sp.]
MTTEANGAIFSDDRVYRYLLWRTWDMSMEQDRVMFIGLNPSTADETEDDPTIRRCIRFAQRWGYGGLYMTNIFGYRSTTPKELSKLGVEPIGPANDSWLVAYRQRSQLVIAAWGTGGALGSRGETVKELLPDLHCLGVTKKGHPKHPLYLKANTEWKVF